MQAGCHRDLEARGEAWLCAGTGRWAAGQALPHGSHIKKKKYRLTLILDTACLGLFPFFFLLFIFPTFLLLHFMSWCSGVLLFLGPAPEGSHCIPLGPAASPRRVWGSLLPTLSAESGLFPFPSSLLLQAFAFLTLFPLQEFLLVISQMPVLPPVLFCWDSSCRGRKPFFPFALLAFGSELTSL